MYYLHRDIILYILSFCDGFSLLQLSLVSKRYRRLTFDETLWRQLCRYLPSPNGIDPLIFERYMGMDPPLKRYPWRWKWCSIARQMPVNHTGRFVGRTIIDDPSPLTFPQRYCNRTTGEYERYAFIIYTGDLGDGVLDGYGLCIMGTDTVTIGWRKEGMSHGWGIHISGDQQIKGVWNNGNLAQPFISRDIGATRYEYGNYSLVMRNDGVRAILTSDRYMIEITESGIRSDYYYDSFGSPSATDDYYMREEFSKQWYMSMGLNRMIFFFDDATFYVGDFEAGFRRGQGLQTWADGSSYDGQWVNDEPVDPNYRNKRWKRYFLMTREERRQLLDDYHLD